MEPEVNKNEVGDNVEADRTLASVVRVLGVLPIKDADRIEIAQVLGWEVVVRKGDFKVGDLGIYFSIGSVLEENDDTKSLNLQGKPLKTKKMRGALSQGLLGPLDWVKAFNGDPATVDEGDDLTKLMNVKKWIAPEELDQYDKDATKVCFPTCVPKTNEERVQNVASDLPKFAGKNVVLTQKFDGTSATFLYRDKKFSICGRNFTLLENTGKGVAHYFDIAERYKLEEKMAELGLSIAIQGEIIGPKINGNRHKVEDIEFYVFNIYDHSKEYYYTQAEIDAVCEKIGLKKVMMVYQGAMKDEWLNVKDLLACSDLQRYASGEICEGIVLKTDHGYNHARLSVKIISNNYLIKYKL